MSIVADTSEEEKSWEAARVTRILTHDFPQYFAVISRIRQEVHAIGPEGTFHIYKIYSQILTEIATFYP